MAGAEIGAKTAYALIMRSLEKIGNDLELTKSDSATERKADFDYWQAEKERIRKEMRRKK